ncbi:hypothetical protein Tco_0521800 [Tanacetum coccineum]
MHPRTVLLQKKYSIVLPEDKLYMMSLGKEHVNSTFTLSTANTPPQSAGNTPTDSDDGYSKMVISSTNLFCDAEEGGQNRTNHKDQQTCLFACFLSQEEPKKVSQALADESWVEAMQEELLQFKLQEVWVLCDLPEGKRVIGTKWVFRNKRDERGNSLMISSLDPPSFYGEGFLRSYAKGFKMIVPWDILNKFDFRTIKPASTPIEAHKSLGKDEEDFKSLQKVSHLHAVKRIFRYLKHQPKLGLWYPKDSPFHLEAFSDSDYAGDNHDRRSTSGGCQYLGRRLVSWQCKKQTIVAISSIEAE